jgi:hypothetical protein
MCVCVCVCVCVCGGLIGERNQMVGWAKNLRIYIYIFILKIKKKYYFNIFLNEIHFKNNFYYNVVIA